MSTPLSDPEIHKMLGISTGHMTEADDKLLKGGVDISISFFPKVNSVGLTGLFIPLDRSPHRVVDGDIRRLRKDGFSDAFLKIIELAFKAEFDWIMFDGDGPVYTELPTFDW